MDELKKLQNYLEDHNIAYQRIDKEKGLLNRHQIIVFEHGKRLWDAICQYGSYGYEEGLLEVYGDPVIKPEDGDSVCGWLTAEDVIQRWEDYKNGQTQV